MGEDNERERATACQNGGIELRSSGLQGGIVNSSENDLVVDDQANVLNSDVRRIARGGRALGDGSIAAALESGGENGDDDSEELSHLRSDGAQDEIQDDEVEEVAAQLAA